MTHERDTVRRWAAKLGFKLEPFPIALRQTVAHVLKAGRLSACGLASWRGISRTAASNRLRAAQLAGLLHDTAVGKELVFELCPGVERYPWIGNEEPTECRRCGHAPAPEKEDTDQLEQDQIEASADRTFAAATERYAK